MSIRLMSAIFETEFRDLPDEEGNITKGSTAKLVLLALADHANDEGEGAYPGLTKMERKTALSRQTIINTYGTLKYNGVIYLVGTSRKNTNNYTINTASFPKATADSQPILLVNPLDQSSHLTSTSQATLPEVVNPLDPNHPLTIQEPSNSANADSQNLQEVVLEANKKVDAILKMEQEAKERENAGQAWRGRELLAPAHISYGDWWHSQTGLHMYGAKAKAKRDTGWEKAFREWEENELTVFALQEAYNSTVAWKKTIASPNEITGTAKAMQAAKVQIKQTAPVTYDQDGAPESW